MQQRVFYIRRERICGSGDGGGSAAVLTTASFNRPKHAEQLSLNNWLQVCRLNTLLPLMGSTLLYDVSQKHYQLSRKIISNSFSHYTSFNQPEAVASLYFAHYYSREGDLASSHFNYSKAFLAPVVHKVIFIKVSSND